MEKKIETENDVSLRPNDGYDDAADAHGNPAQAIVVGYIKDEAVEESVNDKRKTKRAVIATRGSLKLRQCHCQICYKEYAYSGNLPYHKALQHQHRFGKIGGTLAVAKKKPLLCKQCKICGKEFINISEHHNCAHSPVKGLVCNICGKAFVKKSYLETHKRSHSEERSFSCDICHKSYKHSSHVLRHKALTHSHIGYRTASPNKRVREPQKRKLKSFKCPHAKCTASFYQKCDLVRYTLIHTGERPFKCDQCESAFTQRGSLKRHKEAHSRVKSFLCKTCGKGFSQKYVLTEHEKKHFVNV